ncbi:unnamed protein product [Callosobruchus maculatus]|uniref:Molybdopterin synthase catalytic subunit n=1 Tax=Callosobruchus maculatus TaxID=64391 RepID=A0A653CY22_CALMS|nr:unnamed protein product [Callosobruchus maculatus]
MNHIELVKERISIDAVSDLASSPSCGAISMFIGTTRDNFDGKTVIKLEYEAYESMAKKSIAEICTEIREKWPAVENIVVFHRLGVVPVKEASIVIAVSSPHREEALKAVEWCINSVKKSATIWKKEIYADSKGDVKPNRKKQKLEIKQKVDASLVPPHLIQISANNEQLNERIEKFMTRKRLEINLSNIKEFCDGAKDPENSCARIDAVFQKRKDSKSHLLVNRVLNSYQHRDQMNSSYLTKYLPKNGIEERLETVEFQLNLTSPVPRTIYQRLKMVEDALMKLESISPEYIQFWDKSLAGKPVKKKIFSIEDIDALIAETEKRLKKT